MAERQKANQLRPHRFDLGVCLTRKYFFWANGGSEKKIAAKTRQMPGTSRQCLLGLTDMLGVLKQASACLSRRRGCIMWTIALCTGSEVPLDRPDLASASSHTCQGRLSYVCVCSRAEHPGGCAQGEVAVTSCHTCSHAQASATALPVLQAIDHGDEASFAPQVCNPC